MSDLTPGAFMAGEYRVRRVFGGQGNDPHRPMRQSKEELTKLPGGNTTLQKLFGEG